MVRFILGTLATLGTLVLAILIEQGNPATYIVATPMLIAILMPFFATLAVWSIGEWLQAWKDALGARTARLDKTSARRSADIWAFSERAAYAAGGAGFITGLILMLSTLRQLSELGEGLAITLACPFYVILIGLVCRILKARVEARIEGGAP